LGGSHAGGARPLRDLNGIGEVIAVAVRNENIVRFNGADIDMAGQRIGRDERIEKEFLTLDFNRERSMSVKTEFHVRRFKLSGFSGGPIHSHSLFLPGPWF